MPPRVRIPPSPPMCYKCEKRSQGREIVELQTKIDFLFKKVDEDATLANDFELIRLIDIMGEKVDQYRKK